MKITKEELKQIIREELEGVIDSTPFRIYEKADASKVDPERFPMKLSQVVQKKPEEIDVLATGGDDDGTPGDDTVDAQPGTVACKKLKPSQSSMNIEKACQFAICAILKTKPFPNGPGGDLGAIITSDAHIMDGHHRWIASGMVDPNSKVGGFIVDFPAKQMIAALNMITAKLGISKGKEGSGSFDQFNKEGILAQLQNLAAKGFWGASAEECQRACEQFTGKSGEEAIEAAADKMARNASQLTLSVPSGFPARPDMPVISKGEGHLDAAIKLLKTGQVDLNEPYASPDQTNESFKSEEDKVLNERWMRMAGISNKGRK